MSLTTTISDYVIWTRHIHGDPAMMQKLISLKAGDTVTMRINGKSGVWRKMDNGKDGRPTSGLRPVGQAQTIWRELYKTRRGDVVPIEISETETLAEAMPEIIGRLIRTEADRKAALEALMSPILWENDMAAFDRDLAHER